jgi:hypothetical protein
MSVEARALLVPVLLLAGALVTVAIPSAARRARLLGAVMFAALALAAAADLIVLISGGPVTASFGEAVPGVPLSLRADPTGLALVVGIVVATLVSLDSRGRGSGQEAALLLTAAGASLAALAGNAVVLFAGVEIANLGALLLDRAARGRLGRGAITAFAVQHGFGLMLLLAALQLVVADGTSDPYALPAAAIGLAVGVPWAISGVARLLAVAWWPGGVSGDATRSSLAVGAIPCGAAILFRLTAGLDGASMPVLTDGLAAAGWAVAMLGGVMAWRRQGDPRRAGRALVLSITGSVIALAGISGGGAALAAGLIALELAVLTAPAWSHGVGPGRTARGVAALALATAGGLPVGFGTTAVVLEVGTVLALGRAYVALDIGLGVAALVAAAAGLGAARAALEVPGSRARGAGHPSLTGSLGLLLGLAAAVIPGTVGAIALAPLAGGGGLVAVDALSLSGPGGSWPGGYVTLAAAAALLAGGSVWALAGWPVQGFLAPPALTARPSRGAGLVAARRRAGPVLRGAAGALSRVDDWLVTQPGMLLAVAAAAIALFFPFR